MAREHRAAVRAYYAFARMADDIADSPQMSVIQKLGALDGLEHALVMDAVQSPSDQALHLAHTLGVVLRQRHIPLSYATELLVAFRADARNTPVRTWADLTAYCEKSAVPVGRFLLALHGQKGGWESSDALCMALQILNHVQDIRRDSEDLRRCYVPLEWLNANGIDLIDILNPGGHRILGISSGAIRDDAEHYAEAGIDSSSATPKPIDPAKLRMCLNMMLDETDKLLASAARLPDQLTNRGLAAQSAAIICLAVRLLKCLRAHDPWTTRIQLRLRDWIAAAFAGARRWVGGP